MTVSWHGRLASVSGAAGGEFDDGCAVGRRDWPCFGGPAGDRLWNSDQGIQLRQHADPVAGVVGVLAPACLFGLWMAVRELKNIARGLACGAPQSARWSATVRDQRLRRLGPRDQPACSRRHRQRRAVRRAATVAWMRLRCATPAATGRPSRRRQPPPPQAEAQSAVLIDVAEGARTRTGRGRPADADPRPSCVQPPAHRPKPRPARFDDTWPRPDRAKPANPSPRRGPRTPSTFDETEPPRRPGRSAGHERGPRR